MLKNKKLKGRFKYKNKLKYDSITYIPVKNISSNVLRYIKNDTVVLNNIEYYKFLNLDIITKKYITI